MSERFMLPPSDRPSLVREESESDFYARALPAQGTPEFGGVLDGVPGEDDLGDEEHSEATADFEGKSEDGASQGSAFAETDMDRMRTALLWQQSVGNPGSRPGRGFLKPTPDSVGYGEGRNRERRPTSFFPNSSWAVRPHRSPPRRQIGAGRSEYPGEDSLHGLALARTRLQSREGIDVPEPGQAQPAQQGTGGLDENSDNRRRRMMRRVDEFNSRPRRSNRVFGKYFRTFAERRGHAGLFGALFGRGMRRANAARDERARDRLLRTGADPAEKFAQLQEEMGYRLQNRVGASIPEANEEEEEGA